MDIGRTITQYRIQAGMTIDELAAKSGVAKGTLNKITGGATANPTILVLAKIAGALGLSVADFVDESKKPALSGEAMALAGDYDGLDGHGRRVLRAVLDEEKRRMARAEAAARPAFKVIPLIGNSFAAGRGDPDFGNPWEDYSVPADSTADFAVRINGNSMEPYLPDGSVALGQKRAPRDGEVAALLLDGEFLCKQVCQDMVGNLYLFSLNRARKDADTTVYHDAERSLTCFGTILMERVPLPSEI